LAKGLPERLAAKKSGGEKLLLKNDCLKKVLQDTIPLVIMCEISTSQRSKGRIA
jgi:hypothetical protein